MRMPCHIRYISRPSSRKRLLLPTPDNCRRIGHRHGLLSRLIIYHHGQHQGEGFLSFKHSTPSSRFPDDSDDIFVFEEVLAS
jgi:hypothetical protein